MTFLFWLSSPRPLVLIGVGRVCEATSIECIFLNCLFMEWFIHGMNWQLQSFFLFIHRMKWQLRILRNILEWPETVESAWMGLQCDSPTILILQWKTTFRGPITNGKRARRSYRKSPLMWDNIKDGLIVRHTEIFLRFLVENGHRDPVPALVRLDIPLYQFWCKSPFTSEGFQFRRRTSASKDLGLIHLVLDDVSACRDCGTDLLNGRDRNQQCGEKKLHFWNENVSAGITQRTKRLSAYGDLVAQNIRI